MECEKSPTGYHSWCQVDAEREECVFCDQLRPLSE